MHSGSFISPKHPAIPVSIGIASIVLEGRPAVIDGGTSATSSSRTTGSDGGTGPGGGGGGGPDEDGGFFSVAGGAVGTECHPKSFNMTDAAKRINLKLQQIRSCPGTSKDVVENMVTVEAGSSGGDYDNYGVETYVNEARSSETTPLVFSAKAWSRDHIYSGFEKMKLIGVSPIKVPPAAASMSSFINFSGSSTVNSKKKSEVGGGGGGAIKQRTREGPHCEQFLKKVGVIKIDPVEEAEHSCSYRNEFCLRWQSYFKQLSSLLTTGEAICIEVYLGPENHAILLEQWILKLKIKSSDSTMTLQSLCAAIRSQLYFSQISAWTDLIKNSLEPEIFNHPRIKKAAGEGVGSNNETSPLGLPRAKLDILFRIRGYDNTACFNETPNVHNFPDAIVADNYVIEVVLKSLPRLERIPRINDEMDAKMDEALVNDRIDGPCHEKGKHRCTFRVEDEEDPQMGEEESAAMSHREKQLLKYKKRMMKREKKKKALESGGSTSSVGSNEAVPMVVTPPVCKSPALNIPVPQGHANNCGVPPAYTSSINLIQPPLYSNCDDLYQAASCANNNNNNNTKATQTAIFLALSSSGTVTTVATQTDASGCCCLCANPQQQPAPPTCTNSDSKMQYINSNNLRRDYTTSSNCDTSQPEVDAVIAAQRRREESKGLRKAELLLQAIQRTAIINDHQPTAAADDAVDAATAHFSNNNYYSGSYNDNNNVGSDTAKCERSECDTFTFSKEPLDLGDCRLCKRQKTKHNFKLALKSDSESGSGSSSSSSGTSSTNNSPPGCRRTLSESLVGHFTLPSSSKSAIGAKHGGGAVKRDSEGDDDLSEGRLSTSTGAVGTLSFEQLKSYRRAFSEDVIDTISLSGALSGENKEGCQQCGCGKSTLKNAQNAHGSSSLFATPHAACRLPPTSTPAAGCSKAPLFVNCTESDCSVSTASSVSPHKKQILSCTAVSGAKPASAAYYTIPKINLTNIFNVSPLAREDSGFASTSSPIPIDESVGGSSGGVFNFSESSRLMVQKSSSAPTCHLSPGSLSPRFLRHAYKHQRSRYLSERSSVSERSSIGSDEQLSEDEYPFLVDSNGTSYGSNFHLSPSTTPLSPLKFGSAQQRPFSRSFSKNLFRFGRLPLLGTLEESLLQRRISPKFQVADFKVLLGASGSFCPTQLTIPVASYFYELPGQHLSTPYVCELRLPRKGYSIPRQGTVQVTLLNPLGTVVRMFVVPYDFRDMPAMSTTFIRQRILAYDDSSAPKGSATTAQPRNVEQLSNAEQMKLLRYAIHLRFQTSRSGKLSLHTDIRLLISRRTDCDTAAAHAKNLLEAPNELKVVTIVPDSPKFSQRMDKQ